MMTIREPIDQSIVRPIPLPIADRTLEHCVTDRTLGVNARARTDRRAEGRAYSSTSAPFKTRKPGLYRRCSLTTPPLFRTDRHTDRMLQRSS